MAFGFGGLLGGGTIPNVQMPDGLPVAGGQGSPLVDAFLALQGQRLKDAATAPRDAYTGDLQVFGPDGHPTDEAMDRASGLAGLAMTGSLPFKAPAGALRSFGGAAAKDDPLAALEASLAHFEPAAPPPGPRRVDPSAPSWDLYHGSEAGPDFARFDPTKAQNPAEQALFLAPDPATASGYAGAPRAGAEAGSRVFRTTVEPGKTDVFDLAHLAETDPTFNARARELTVRDSGATYGPAFDDFMSDFARSRARDQDIAKQAAEMGHSLGPDAGSRMSFGYGHIGAAVERAKAQGLDTAILRGLAEHGGDDQVVALTPGRVRSAYAPDQLLYSGGPAGVAAGLPAIAASSDPKGNPVSAGLGAPSMLDGLSPEMIARLIQAQQASAAPSPVNSLLFGQQPMGAPQSFAGAPGATMPAPTAPDADGPGDAPAGPQATGAIARPAPPVAMTEGDTQRLERQQASPADLSALSAVPPGGAPISPPPQVPSAAPAAPGRPPAAMGAPAAAAPAAAPAQASDHSLLNAWKGLADTGVGDQLMAFGSGLLSGRGAAGWSRAVDNMSKASATSATNDLARTKAAGEQAKQQRELATQNQTAKIIAQRLGMPIEDATALASNPAYVQSFLTSQYGAPQNFRVNADGSQSYVPGSQADPNYKAAEAGAAREPIDYAAAKAGAVTKATNDATPEEPYVLSPGQTRFDGDSNQPIAAVPKAEDATADIKNWQEAKRQGYAGSLVDYQNERARAGSSQTTVNMPPAEKAEQAKIGEARGSVVSDQITAGRSAQDRIRTLDQMSGALASAGSNITTGPLGEPVLRAKQALGGLLGKELPGTSATEMFNNMGPILAGEAARSITNRPAQIEFTTMLNSKPGLMNSLEGNRAMMDVMRQRAVADADLSNIAARSGSADEYLKKKDDYEAEHPMVNPFTGQPFGANGGQGQGQGQTAGGSPSGPIVQLRTQAEFAAAPSGTRFIAPDGKLRVKP